MSPCNFLNVGVRGVFSEAYAERLDDRLKEKAELLGTVKVKPMTFKRISANRCARVPPYSTALDCVRRDSNARSSMLTPTWVG